MLYDKLLSVIQVLFSSLKSQCSTAVSSAYGGRHTHRSTVVVRAADGRRTITRTP